MGDLYLGHFCPHVLLPQTCSEATKTLLTPETSDVYLFSPKGSPFPKLLERTLTGQPASKKGQPQFKTRQYLTTRPPQWFCIVRSNQFLFFLSALCFQLFSVRGQILWSNAVLRSLKSRVSAGLEGFEIVRFVLQTWKVKDGKLSVSLVTASFFFWS